MSKKEENFDEQMAQQIGDAGSTQDSAKGLGKLERAEQILTGKEVLSDSEKKDMEAFQERIRQACAPHALTVSSAARSGPASTR